MESSVLFTAERIRLALETRLTAKDSAFHFVVFSCRQQPARSVVQRSRAGRLANRQQRLSLLAVSPYSLVEDMPISSISTASALAAEFTVLLQLHCTISFE